MKVFNYLIVIFGISVAAYIYFYLHKAPQKNAGEVMHKEITKPDKAVEKTTSNVIIKIEKEEYFDPVNLNANEIVETQEHYAQLEKYLLETGQDYGTTKYYQEFSIEVLEEMAKNLDIYAMNVLAMKYLKNGDGYKAKKMFEKALVYGNVEASSDMAYLYIKPNDYKASYKDLGRETAKRITYIKSSAYQLLSEKLGYVRAVNLSTKMRPDQYIEALELANELYKDIQSKRNALGFGEYPKGMSLQKS